MIWNKSYGPDSLTYYAGRSNSSAPTVDGNFILGGSGRVDDNTKHLSHLTKFNSLGDTLWQFQQVFDMSYVGNAGCQSDDGGYALVGTTDDEDIPMLPMYLGYILKIDSAGNFEWLKKYYHENYTIGLTSIVPLSDGGFAASGVRVWVVGSNLGEFDLFLIRVDASGDEVWRKAWGTVEDDHDAVVGLASDGNLLVAGVVDDSSNDWSAIMHHYVAKLNIDSGNIIWEKKFEPGLYQSLLYKVFEVSDGGILVGGVYFGGNDVPNQIPSHNRGGLTKLSANGDSLWMRSYEFDTGYPCYFRDVIETPDGGFAAVGVANVSPGYPSDDTWIVKVDQYGCLVPGCHLINVEELEASGGRMMVYPNPVRDVLNVYLATSPPTPLRGRGGTPMLSLTDMQGRTVKQWRAESNHTTYMADVSGLGAGVYVLRYEGGGVVLTEKVVVE